MHGPLGVAPVRVCRRAGGFGQHQIQWTTTISPRRHVYRKPVTITQQRCATLRVQEPSSREALRHPTAGICHSLFLVDRRPPGSSNMVENNINLPGGFAVARNAGLV